MNKISLSNLQKVLSPKEMKNITGGSTYWVACADGSSFPVTADSCDIAEWGLSHYPNCDWVAIIGEGC